MVYTNGTCYFDGKDVITTTLGTSTQVLTSNGAGVAPTYQIAPGGDVKYAKITLTSQQIKALHGTPITIVTAPGSNKMLIPMYCSFYFVYGGSNAFVVPFSSGINILWKNIAGSSAFRGIASSCLDGTASIYGYDNVAYVASSAPGALDNQPFIVGNPYVDEISGNAADDNTLTINLVYQIANLAP